MVQILSGPFFKMSSIDNLVQTGTTPTLLLKSGKYVGLRGILDEISYLPSNSRCEVWFMKLKEAPNYMFKVNIPNSAVDVMNDLCGAMGTEVFLKGKNPLSIGGRGIAVNLSYAYVNGYEFSFTRWTAKKQQINNI